MSLLSRDSICTPPRGGLVKGAVVIDERDEWPKALPITPNLDLLDQPGGLTWHQWQRLRGDGFRSWWRWWWGAHRAAGGEWRRAEHLLLRDSRVCHRSDRKLYCFCGEPEVHRHGRRPPGVQRAPSGVRGGSLTWR